MDTMDRTQQLSTGDEASQSPALLDVRPPHVVIVGCGFAGLQAARGLADVPCTVTVIDRNNHFLFQPLLYQVATAYLSPADISTPIRNILKHQTNTEVIMSEVTGVDVAGKRVLLGKNPDGEVRAIPYDYLVLATGAGQSYFGHPEWSHYAPGLKSINDATWIRRRILLAFEAAEIETDPAHIQALLTFVIVGGGPTGVEMAGAIAELARKSILRDFRHINAASAQVVLVEALPRILPSFPESLAKKTAHKLQHLGVDVRTNSPVQEVNENGVIIDGKLLPSKTVVWAAGVSASPAGKWLGIETDKAGRVPVEHDLSVPGHPEIFVIGDTATLKIKGKPLPGIAPVAMQEGQYIAKLIDGRITGHPVTPFRYVDKGYLATVGRGYAIGNIGNIQFYGLFGWLVWAVVHIFYLVGFRNRLLVLIQWAVSYSTYQRGARLITPEEDPAKREPLNPE